MDYNEYLENKKEIYQSLIEFLDNEENSEVNFNNLNEVLNKQKIQETKEDLKTLFLLLLNISINHHRPANFFNKIEQILSLFKIEMNQFFTNFEIFNIFKRNKRILLFLIKEGIFNINQSISNILSNGWFKKNKYQFYFYPEIKQFLNLKQHEKMLQKAYEMNDVNSNNFEQNRKLGENNNYICQLIQNDEIDDFVIYVNSTNYSLSAKIEQSIFETNFYLLNKRISLLDYAAFFGSINILRFLIINKVNFSPYTWICAIHGRNPDVIHLLEEYKIKPNENSFLQCFRESIICHHNEITNYLRNILNFLDKNQEDKLASIKSYNFEFFPTEEEISKVDFYLACKYDSFFIAKYLIENSQNFDVNEIFTEGKKNVHQTALNAAIREGNKEIVELLLSIPSIDINSISFSFFDDIKIDKRSFYTKESSSLHIAVEKGDEEIVSLLLKNKNIEVNQPFMYHDRSSIFACHVEKTALNIAIEKGYDNIVEMLLEHSNIDVNVKSRHNDCNYGYQDGHDRYIEKIALILAVERENSKIVSLLLKHPKIDVNIISRYHDYIYANHRYEGNSYVGRTALQIAIEKSNSEIVQLLLSNSNIELNYCIFSYKCKHEDEDEKNYKTDQYIYEDDSDNYEIDCIQIDKSKNIDPSFGKEFSFDEIAFDGYCAKPFTQKELSPLFISVNEKNYDITQFLLNCHDIDVNFSSLIIKNRRRKYYKPIQKAIEDESTEIVQLLIDHGANNYYI